MFDKDFPNLPPDLEYLHGGESPYSEFAAERAAEAIGRAVECVPLVLNGCCGNINPWSPFEPDFVPDHRRMGNALAERASAVIRQMQFAEVRHLDWRVRRVPLALKAPDPERLSEAERILAAHPEPLWSEENPRVIDPQWYRAASVKSVELLRRREGRFLYEIQAFRVGETAFVGLPGEPFVEGQLAIKIASPAYYTFVAQARARLPRRPWRHAVCRIRADARRPSTRRP
jgi:hypothetical protein